MSTKLSESDRGYKQLLSDVSNNIDNLYKIDASFENIFKYISTSKDVFDKIPSKLYIKTFDLYNLTAQQIIEYAEQFESTDLMYALFESNKINKKTINNPKLRTMVIHFFKQYGTSNDDWYIVQKINSLPILQVYLDNYKSGTGAGIVSRIKAVGSIIANENASSRNGDKFFQLYQPLFDKLAETYDEESVTKLIDESIQNDDYDILYFTIDLAKKIGQSLVFPLTINKKLCPYHPMIKILKYISDHENINYVNYPAFLALLNTFKDDVKNGNDHSNEILADYRLNPDDNAKGLLELAIKYKNYSAIQILLNDIRFEVTNDILNSLKTEPELYDILNLKINNSKIWSLIRVELQNNRDISEFLGEYKSGNIRQDRLKTMYIFANNKLMNQNDRLSIQNERFKYYYLQKDKDLVKLLSERKVKYQMYFTHLATVLLLSYLDDVSNIYLFNALENAVPLFTRNALRIDYGF